MSNIYEEKSKKVRKAFLLLMITVLLLMIAGVTYAWFSYNRVVDTNKVSAATGEDNIKLLVSSKGGDSFSGKETAAISQINDADKMKLMPVSTADLKHFVYSPFTDDGKAETFLDMEDEEFIYHGRIYIKAEASKEYNGRTMTVYLDATKAGGGTFVTAEDQKLLNASRLGLVDGNGNPVIFRVSDKSSEKKAQARNTYIGGQKVGDGKVLVRKNGNIAAVDDPAVDFDDYAMMTSDGAIQIPEKSLMKLEINKEYAIDVYFYLEGCDPDCSSKVMLEETDMHLAFFGVLD